MNRDQPWAGRRPTHGDASGTPCSAVPLGRLDQVPRRNMTIAISSTSMAVGIASCVAE